MRSIPIVVFRPKTLSLGAVSTYCRRIHYEPNMAARDPTGSSVDLFERFLHLASRDLQKARQPANNITFKCTPSLLPKLSSHLLLTFLIFDEQEMIREENKER
ncbi:hypothetical protein AVEN_39270-1 [Araneus ventricosus]|uniref:Uncharacterized protein n=1 Tax=Araneus ventricosus TaxID=182803 RepID=A0A4Y2MZ49_ARAVE|nr:hypothetical protein AVEN_39270-1 [Araneus ventricosus]